MKLLVNVSAYLEPYEERNHNKAIVEREIKALEEILGTQLTPKMNAEGRGELFAEIPFDEFYNKTKQQILRRIDNMRIDEKRL